MTPRHLETHIIDAFEQMGVTVRHEWGTPYVIKEHFDDDTGELLKTHHVFNVEQLASILADSFGGRL